MAIEITNAWNTYYKSFQIATKFHEGQVDKAGISYIHHPKRVAEAILNDNNTDFDYIDDEQKIFILTCATVAVLHDVLEDTECTEEYLREQGFSEDIIEGVKSVTRNENESYGNFVKRAAENQYGKIVKLHDLKDNLDLTRLGKITKDDVPRINKYLKWYKYLNN